MSDRLRAEVIDGACGYKGSYCIGRNLGTHWQFWNPEYGSRWVSAGMPFTDRKLAQAIVNLLNEAALTDQPDATAPAWFQRLNQKLKQFAATHGIDFPYSETLEGRVMKVLEGAVNPTRELPPVAPPAQETLDAVALVKLVLSQHQTAYARFHCTEGRKVIESHEMAIGYAAVELEKALRSPASTSGKESRDGH